MKVPTPAEIRARRLGLGASQSQVATLAGMDQALVARVEKGKVDPRVSTLVRIIEALNHIERGRPAVRAKEVMVAPVAVLDPAIGVRDAIRTMRDRGLSQLPVEASGRRVGVATEASLLRVFHQQSESEQDIPVRDAMDPPLPEVTGETEESRLEELLEVAPAVLVVEKGETLGIVARSDLLRRLSEA